MAVSIIRLCLFVCLGIWPYPVLVKLVDNLVPDANPNIRRDADRLLSTLASTSPICRSPLASVIDLYFSSVVHPGSWEALLTHVWDDDNVRLDSQFLPLFSNHDVCLASMLALGGSTFVYRTLGRTTRTGCWSPISFSLARTGPVSLISPNGQPFSFEKAAVTELWFDTIRKHQFRRIGNLTLIKRKSFAPSWRRFPRALRRFDTTTRSKDGARFTMKSTS